jgi:peptidoglycan/LPS O-acetylase OafA/YrhL
MPALDALRGAAVIMVGLFHAAVSTVPVWSQFVDSLWVGVDLFFVLSGFLITGILIDTRKEANYFKNFYIRRSLRIFPLYYGTLTMVLVVLPLAVPLVRANEYWMILNHNKWWLIVYMQNFFGATQAHHFPGFGHFWSLAIEEQFYWVWPLVIRRLTLRQIGIVSACICVIEPVIRGVLYMEGVSTWALNQLTFTRLDSLAWGALAAVLIRLGVTRRLQKSGLLAGGLVIAIIAIYSGGLLPYGGPVVTLFAYSGLGCFFASTLLLSSQASSAGPLLSLLSWFGKISYGIYVFHWPITNVLLKNPASAHLPSLVRFVISFAVAVVGAYLSWHILEKHFLRLKDRFPCFSQPTKLSNAFPAVHDRQAKAQSSGV